MVIFARILKGARCAASSLFADATWALRRIPAMRDWLEALGLFAIFLILAGLIALPSGLITLPVRAEWDGLFPVALIAFFVPALGEEIVFRVWLQPSPSSPSMGEVVERSETGGGGVAHPSRRYAPPSPSRGGRIARTLPAIALFVLWHPAQVWLGLPMAQEVFLEPAFLVIAGLFGVACTISWQRSGSIWPAVILHWLTVVGWKALAG